MGKYRNIYVFLLFLYGFAAFVLFLFSYTQVDLNLTLSQATVWQTIQKWFQYIGYYNRPLATVFFVSIIVVLFVLYGLILRSISRNTIKRNHIWYLIFFITAAGIFAYPAFSYDIFNYLFTAKTVAVYNANPYMVKPLDFAGVDPWILFLRWTHLTSAYTPLWIGLSVIPFVFGFTYFLLILWNTKFMLACFYLLSVWAIGKIVTHTKPTKSLYAIAVFALNPLVYIEAVVSPHNDIVMMGLALVAWYLAVSKRTVLSYLFLALSVAMKLMTIMLYPAAFVGWKRSVALSCMLIALVLGFWKREILPWYFLWVMPYIAVMADRSELVVLATGVSLGLILRYAPFIYFGDYANQMMTWRTWLTIVPVALSLLWVIFLRIQAKTR